MGHQPGWYLIPPMDLIAQYEYKSAVHNNSPDIFLLGSEAVHLRHPELGREAGRKWAIGWDIGRVLYQDAQVLKP